MELSGGNEALAKNNPTALDNAWIDSLGPYEEWRPFAFQEKSLVPIINFLPDAPGNKLRTECEALLREYFLANLAVNKTGLAGHASTNTTEEFDEKKLVFTGKNAPSLNVDLARNTSGLTKIVVTSQGHVDTLKLTYNIYMAGNQLAPVTGVFGIDRNTTAYDSPPIEFREGERISALEAWVDWTKDSGTLRRLAIRTNQGRRFPDKGGGFYGTNHKPGDKLEVIAAPRVRALRGFSKRFIHALGLIYLDLVESMDSRPFC